MCIVLHSAPPSLPSSPFPYRMLLSTATALVKDQQIDAFKREGGMFKRLSNIWGVQMMTCFCCRMDVHVSYCVRNGEGRGGGGRFGKVVGLRCKEINALRAGLPYPFPRVHSLQMCHSHLTSPQHIHPSHTQSPHVPLSPDQPASHSPIPPVPNYLLLPPVRHIVAHHHDGTQSGDADHALVLLPRQGPRRHQEEGTAVTK